MTKWTRGATLGGVLVILAALCSLAVEARVADPPAQSPAEFSGQAPSSPPGRRVGPPPDRPVGPPQDRPVGPPPGRPVGPPVDRPVGPPERPGPKEVEPVSAPEFDTSSAGAFVALLVGGVLVLVERRRRAARRG